MLTYYNTYYVERSKHVGAFLAARTALPATRARRCRRARRSARGPATRRGPGALRPMRDEPPSPPGGPGRHRHAARAPPPPPGTRPAPERQCLRAASGPGPLERRAAGGSERPERVRTDRNEYIVQSAVGSVASLWSARNGAQYGGYEQSTCRARSPPSRNQRAATSGDHREKPQNLQWGDRNESN